MSIESKGKLNECEGIFNLCEGKFSRGSGKKCASCGKDSRDPGKLYELQKFRKSEKFFSKKTNKSMI
ncbi:MAG TPA: hypothetical protein PK536_12450 [Ignavibacteria bacterium]|nr:hypothetical protein [Bacteroidota bacterium]HRI86247.1 hypothetical protein [Ignavibacteria bacterium]HRK00455.1 hypothetical protein [Ignavibacteria bacterium]